MKHYGIARKTLLATLIPLLVMAVLLESFFVLTSFADLDRSLLERSKMLTRQLASSAEYAVFSGNAVLLKQNVEVALSLPDVASILVFDEKSKLILDSGNGGLRARMGDAESWEPVYQDNDILRLYEPIMATQINLDGLVSAPAVASKLGAVVLEVSKQRLNKQKNEYLLISLLFVLLVCAAVLVLVIKNVRSITGPIMQMHQSIRRIAGGDLETNISSRCNILELHELANGISDMALQILRDKHMLENRIVESAENLRIKNAEVEQAKVEKALLNENLALSSSELQAIMEANPDLVYVFNPQGKLIRWNTSLAKFCGLSPESMSGRHMSELVCKQDWDALKHWISEVEAKESASAEMHFVRHDGEAVPHQCNGVVLKNPEGAVLGYTGTARDASERKLVAEHLHHAAHYDALTGLPNRTVLSEHLEQAIISSKCQNGHLALMILGLDLYKYVNDNLGHDIGDLLLKEVARRILDALGESGNAARIGGDKFVVLLPTVESIQIAQQAADKLRGALCQPFVIAGHGINISASIGVAVYPEHGSEVKVLFKNADAAMYLAKRSGRNAVVLYAS